MRLAFTIFLFLFFSMSSIAQQKGKASFYGKKFNNRKTASGVLYRKDSLVCAHKTHPFGTLLRVKNVKNDKEVVVKVIDRGPFSKKRIIDLSYAAAKELDFIRDGVTAVEIWIHSDSIN